MGAGAEMEDVIGEGMGESLEGGAVDLMPECAGGGKELASSAPAHEKEEP